MLSITPNHLAKFVLSVNNSSQHASRSTLRIAQLRLKRIQVKVFQDYGIPRPSVEVIYLMCYMGYGSLDTLLGMEQKIKSNADVLIFLRDTARFQLRLPLL